MVDVLADALNKIKVCESKGKYECSVPSTKLVRAVLDTMKKEGYIKEYAEYSEAKAKRLNVTLSKRINDIGVIKPRHATKAREFQEYENRYIPSKDFGILVVSTPKGIMTNAEAKAEGTGGRLIAYVY